MFNQKNIHFIGILGSSMSGLAEIAVKNGAKVSGSDNTYSEKFQHLKTLGISVVIGIDLSSVARADMVVYSAAIPTDNAELVYARENQIPCLERAKFLGKLSENFSDVIAVAGTHGKTTVTAMLAEVFRAAGRSPTVHIGGDFFDGKSGVLVGEDDIFLTEACEYRAGFCALHPTTAVILNIETDHPDYYKSIAELYDAFYRFASNVKEGGVVVAPCSVCVQSKQSIIIGKDVYAKNVVTKNGKIYFDIYVKDMLYAENFSLLIAGQHNVYNALFVIAVAQLYGIKKESVLSALASFKGVKRRFCLLREYRGAKIICDYAHHPTQIRATLSAARQITKGRIFVYFQPHTYSRTEKLFDEFVDVLMDTDDLTIIREYPARETADMGKSAYQLYQKLLERGKACKYAELGATAAELIKPKIFKGDTVLLLGAGDIINLAEFFQ